MSTVIPAKAGIQDDTAGLDSGTLDSRLRGNDGESVTVNGYFLGALPDPLSAVCCREGGHLIRAPQRLWPDVGRAMETLRQSSAWPGVKEEPYGSLRTSRQFVHSSEARSVLISCVSCGEKNSSFRRSNSASSLSSVIRLTSSCAKLRISVSALMALSRSSVHIGDNITLSASPAISGSNRARWVWFP